MRLLQTFLALGVVTGAAFAQSPSTAPASANAQVIGQVTALDAQARQITLKPDTGEAVTVILGDRTLLVRVPPGEKDLKKATRITLPDVAVGDRVLAIGPEADQKVTARSVIVMSKTDLARKQQLEVEDWQKRGTAGTVTAVDAAAKSITLKAGEKSITVQTSDQTQFRRYAPNSVKFSDAKPGTFAEVQVDDRVRVLGDKSADGATVKAEQLVSGTFRQIAGTIISVSPATNEVKIKDLKTNKPLTVHVNSDSTVKKLPLQMAMMMARRYAPAGAQGRGGMGGGRRFGQGGGGMGGGRGGAGMSEGSGGMRGGSGDVGQMIERLPPVTLADLKTGDAIMVSSTSGTDPDNVTAISLLAGVEPLLTASPDSTRDIMSGWNLGGGGGGGDDSGPE
ncbi:MAG TPA: hypothetical protein VG675_15540 [Bryobacteraceae bacterium]|nr:hypothetical protein [Bryobacteraceae bacterium]